MKRLHFLFIPFLIGTFFYNFANFPFLMSIPSSDMVQIELVIKDSDAIEITDVYLGNQKIPFNQSKHIDTLHFKVVPGNHMVMWTVLKDRGWPARVTFKQNIVVPKSGNFFRIVLEEKYIHIVSVDDTCSCN